VINSLVTRAVYVACRGDGAYGAYLQNLSPMENQLRDAQLVCTVSFNFDKLTSVAVLSLSIQKHGSMQLLTDKPM